jgi:hypothetical protein
LLANTALRWPSRWHSLLGTLTCGKEVNTMTAPPRVYHVWTAALAAAGSIALFLLPYACGRTPSNRRAGIAGATPPALSSPNLQREELSVLPGLICGSLDGATPMEDGSVFIWGWAYDPRSGVPASAVVLLDKGQRASPRISVSRERPDVAEVKRNPRLRTSGWNVRLPASPHREHVFTAYAVLADGKLGRLGGKLVVSDHAHREAGAP